MSDYPETKGVFCPFCHPLVDIELIDPERGEYERNLRTAFSGVISRYG